MCSLYHSQCDIPVFEVLIDMPHNTAVMDLLFTMAHWHCLAKLHMHHALLLTPRNYHMSTTHIFAEKASKQHMCCMQSKTQSLYLQSIKIQGSVQIWTMQVHLWLKIIVQKIIWMWPQGHLFQYQKTRTSRRQHKMLNINTYKFHSYGDYARTIWTYGTMDSYLTELVRDW